MDERLARLFRRQQASGFEDIRGAEANITVPVSDKLLNELVAEWVPRSGSVREIEVHTKPDNRFAVRAKVGPASFLPAVNLTVVIDRQAELPGSPVLVLRLEMGGLLSFAGPALRFFDALPPGIRIDNDRIYVDFVKLLEPRGLLPLLDHLEHLQVGTSEGTLILSLRARIR